MSLHARDVERAWGKLAMVRKNTDDYHAYFYHNGKLILSTKRSFGSGKIEGPVQHLIRQQLKLTPGEFDELIACTINRPEYIAILQKKGWIPTAPKPSTPPPPSSP